MPVKAAHVVALAAALISVNTSNNSEADDGFVHVRFASGG